MTLTIEIDKARLKRIAKAWNKGTSQAQIARDFGISRQRVNQIIKNCENYKVPAISFKQQIDNRHETWFRNAPKNT